MRKCNLNLVITNKIISLTSINIQIIGPYIKSNRTKLSIFFPYIIHSLSFFFSMSERKFARYIGIFKFELASIIFFLMRVVYI